MAYPTIQIGRLPVKELPQNPAVETVAQGSQQPPQRLLRIVGQECYPVVTQAALGAMHDDVQGLATGNYLVPVTFGDKSDRNGFYRVYAAQNTEQDWSGEGVGDGWQIDLERVGSELELDFESRLTGPAIVANDFTWNASESLFSPPAGSYAMAPGAAASTSRPCSDGPDQPFYTALGTPNNVRWGCSVANYGNGRARFIDDQGVERSGINFSPANLTSWTMTNGIVQVTPGNSGNTIMVNVWTNGAWAAKHWDLTVANLASTTINMMGWSSVSVLRNDYEAVIVRLVRDYGSGRVTADLTLRRGSRFVEVYMSSPDAGGSVTWKAVRHFAEPGTLGGLGNASLTATSEDSAGNQYTVGSAHTFTADTANGGISATAAVFDCYIGSVVSTSVLNANPDFETNVANWTPTNCTFAQSGTRAHKGSFSGLMTPNGVSAQVSVESEQDAVTGNATYQASGWVWPTSTVTGNIGVSVSWYDATHTLISTTANTLSATGGQWNFLTGHAFTAPPTAAFATLKPIVSGTPAAGQLVWWDEVKLRPYGQSGNLATDLLGQYAGRRGEYVQAVRR
jgi:hypothetical protein